MQSRRILREMAITFTRYGDSLDAPRKATHREWLERYGRNRIEPVRGFNDVVNYCSKYVVKERAWWSVHLSRARYAALAKCRRAKERCVSQCIINVAHQGHSIRFYMTYIV